MECWEDLGMAWVENNCWGKGHLSISNRSNEYNKYITNQRGY
jgi:hypothetical protein